ncbi:MAG: ABC transporter substrate-binding protein [Chloroflexi bacterium]|nr:ABC transporter substrate-binding protein [Chloroflexota bacterium]
MIAAPRVPLNTSPRRWRPSRHLAPLLATVLLAGCTGPVAPRPDAVSGERAAVVADSAPTATSTAGTPAAPVTLTIAYGALTANYLPLWVTYDQGFLAREGIDAELTYMDGSVAVQALATGDAPLSAVGAAVVQSRLSGADVVLIADQAPRLSYALYVKPDITSVEGLRGRTIVTTTPGSANYQGVQLFLRRLGMEFGRDVQVLHSQGGSEQLAILRQGLADAAIFTPPASIRARELGLRELLTLANENIPFINSVVAVNRPWAERNPATVERFLRAYGDGLRLLYDDPVAAKQALARFTRTDDAAVLDETYAFSLPGFPRGAPYPTPEQVQTVLDLLDTPAARTARAVDFIEPRYVRALDEAGAFAALKGR